MELCLESLGQFTELAYDESISVQGGGFWASCVEFVGGVATVVWGFVDFAIGLETGNGQLIGRGLTEVFIGGAAVIHGAFGMLGLSD